MPEGPGIHRPIGCKLGSVLLALAAMTGCAHQESAVALSAKISAAPTAALVTKSAVTTLPPRPIPELDTPLPPVAAASFATEPPRAEIAAPVPAPAAAPIPLHLLAGAIEPIHGEDPTLPDQIIYSSRGKTLEGSYKMCISRDGKVQSVTPVVSIQGADRCVVDTLKTWQFPKLPLMLCKLQTLRFEIPER